MKTIKDFKKELAILRKKEETHVLEGVELGKLLAYENVENLILKEIVFEVKNLKIEKTKQVFKDYLKQARLDFIKVVQTYTVTEHLKLRTAIDSFLIAYDQATDSVIISLLLNEKEEIKLK